MELRGARANNLKTLVMMGSDSDLEIMRECIATLEAFGVAHEVVVASAHRSLDRVISTVREAEERGVKVIIAAAGGAAHLAGVVAGMTVVPVIGVPSGNSPLAGVDALYSTVQMPPGIPVACVGVNASKNAALLAVAILALADPGLHRALVDYRAELAHGVEEKHERVAKALGIEERAR
jgi:5-(carboxyamino)imidazole ribonucleotide mutase